MFSAAEKDVTKASVTGLVCLKFTREGRYKCQHKRSEEHSSKVAETIG
jgi:hypothetical protein